MRHAVRLLVLAFVGLVVLPAGSAVATTTQVSQADDRPLVRVGTEGVYPPFSFHDAKTDKLTGYDIEVIKAVAKKAGWRLEFVETQFDAIFAALEAKRIDVIANQVTVNPEREAKYGLGTTYTYSRGVIVVKKGHEGHQDARRHQGQDCGRVDHDQLGRRRPQGRCQDPGRRGLRPGGGAGRPGPGGPVDQRQHRGARLPQHDRQGRHRDRRQRGRRGQQAGAGVPQG
jgi:hypothetical protein